MTPKWGKSKLRLCSFNPCPFPAVTCAPERVLRWHRQLTGMPVVGTLHPPLRGHKATSAGSGEPTLPAHGKAPQNFSRCLPGGTVWTH